MRLQRAASIKHEHNVFSALSQAEASLSLHTDANFSSLVFGDHFIHSYNCRMKGQDFYLSLHTYSRHDDRCHRIYLVVPAEVIVQETLRCLKVKCASQFTNRDTHFEIHIRSLNCISFRIFIKSMD